MTEIELQKIADESYNRFIMDESIIGFDPILKSYGGGSRRRNKIRNLIYDKYGKEYLLKIHYQRRSHASHRSRTSESYCISPEQRKKMTDGIKKSWVDADDRKHRSRELMIKHCHPKAWTLETNDKRKKSRSGYRHSEETINKIRKSQIGRPLSPAHRKSLCVPKRIPGSLGLRRNDLTKQKLSIIAREQWKNGIHVPIFKSKGQVQVADLLRCEGFNIKEEFFIDGKPYDIFVVDINMIIEFNGTYWHRDPRFYLKNDICQKIWDYDKNKLDIARQKCYRVGVIWQYDWENSSDKIKLLKEILNGII